MSPKFAVFGLLLPIWISAIIHQQPVAIAQGHPRFIYINIALDKCSINCYQTLRASIILIVNMGEHMKD